MQLRPLLEFALEISAKDLSCLIQGFMAFRQHVDVYNAIYYFFKALFFSNVTCFIYNVALLMIFFSIFCTQFGAVVPFIQGNDFRFYILLYLILNLDV